MIPETILSRLRSRNMAASRPVSTCAVGRNCALSACSRLFGRAMPRPAERRATRRVIHMRPHRHACMHIVHTVLYIQKLTFRSPRQLSTSPPPDKLLALFRRRATPAPLAHNRVRGTRGIRRSRGLWLQRSPAPAPPTAYTRRYLVTNRRSQQTCLHPFRHAASIALQRVGSRRSSINAARKAVAPQAIFLANMAWYAYPPPVHLTSTCQFYEPHWFTAATPTR